MPIGAILGAVGTIGGALLTSHAQNKASTQANDAQQAATQAQLQLGHESLDLNKNIYNSNYNTLSPFVSRGNVAGDSINALLGLPSAPAMQSPLGGTAMGTGTVPAPTSGAPGGSQGGSMGLPAHQYGGFVGALQGLAKGPAERVGAMGTEPPGLPTGGINVIGGHDKFGGGQGIPTPVGAPVPVTGQGGAPAPTQTPVNALTANDAFHNFANSAGMQFQMEQGANALNNLYAAHGQLQSGAAMKGMNNYAQQTALNNYFMPYMNLLGGQQAIGAGAASSIAGVGQGFGNTAANINTGMGNAIGNGADAAAQNAYNHGAAQAGMYGQIGGALGGLASSFFPKGAGY